VAAITEEQWTPLDAVAKSNAGTARHVGRRVAEIACSF
jgi:hypothetical protein